MVEAAGVEPTPAVLAYFAKARFNSVNIAFFSFLGPYPLRAL